MRRIVVGPRTDVGETRILAAFIGSVAFSGLRYLRGVWIISIKHGKGAEFFV